MKEKPPGLRRYALGVAAATAFAAVYLLAAPPARRWTAEHIVAPALSVAAGRDGGVTVTHRRNPPSVVVRSGTDDLAAYSIPLGVLFFIPALLLLAVAPDRPYWLLFAAYLVALGLIDLGVVAAGIAWGRAGFTIHQFLDAYVIRPTSIAVPLLFLEHRRRSPARATTPA